MDGRQPSSCLFTVCPRMYQYRRLAFSVVDATGAFGGRLWGRLDLQTRFLKENGFVVSRKKGLVFLAENGFVISQAIWDILG